MAQTIHVTKEPVILEGYQAVMKPSKYGFSLSALVDSKLIEVLEDDRVETLKWAESKLKNPKRSTLKPEPWEEVTEGQYKVKFSWNEETRPPVVDSEGTVITDESTKVPYQLQCNYTPDFILRNGVYLETKGHLTEEDRRKMKAVKKANPDLDIRFVFQAPTNKIRKGSKTSYASWAEKNGFKWCAYHSIPIEWLT